MHCIYIYSIMSGRNMEHGTKESYGVFSLMPQADVLLYIREKKKKPLVRRCNGITERMRKNAVHAQTHTLTHARVVVESTVYYTHCIHVYVL